MFARGFAVEEGVGGEGEATHDGCGGGCGERRARTKLVDEDSEDTLSVTVPRDERTGNVKSRQIGAKVIHFWGEIRAKICPVVRVCGKTSHNKQH